MSNNLRNAINQANIAGVVVELEASNLDQALLTALIALDETTPEANLINAIFLARKNMEQVLDNPDLRSAISNDKEDGYSHFLREQAKLITSLAQNLLDYATSANSDIREKSLIEGLDFVKRTAKDQQGNLKKGLELVTGVLLNDNDEWLSDLNTQVQNSWDGLTGLLKKNKNAYGKFKEGGIDTEKIKEASKSFHPQVFSLLNEIQKNSIALQELLMALKMDDKNKFRQQGRVDIAAKKCRMINPENIRHLTKELDAGLQENNINLHYSVMGKVIITSMAEEMRSQVKQIIKISEYIHHAALFAEWVYDTKSLSQ
ncbi:hypothetical protein ACFFJN_14140 [Erwinia mallotivora]|uniref:hypothetical protein n=1 Tax=Erwinia mallotivora TaxID=69222 RepID=UPI0035EB4FD6